MEATVLALAALEAADALELRGRSKARGWLVDLQQPDGGFPVGPWAPGASWATALAGLYLWEAPDTRPAAVRAAAWLMDNVAVRPDFWSRLRRSLFGSGPVDVDQDLVGWSWRPGTFSWVEPTAWATLLVRKAGSARELPGSTERLREVKAMLADRECVGGGWNYGNRVVFDAALPPNPDTTAVALIAAQGWAREPWVERGFRALAGMMRGTTSPLALSLTRFAHRLHGRRFDGPPADEYQANNGMLPQTRNLAIALLADRPHPLLELS